MPALFIYLIKVNVALLVFCAGYYAVLRHLTFYTLNRWYLLTAIIFSTLYPFIDLSAFINRHQEIAKPIQVVVVNWQVPANTLAQSVSQHNQWYWLQMAFWAGVLLLSIRLAMQLLSLYRLHKKSEPVQLRQYMIRAIEGDINPFSFWKNIYINPANHTGHELDAILEHEQIHVNEWHTLDILLGELSTIFYWFNPGIWLMKKAIRENIEFITDHKILQKGMDCKLYQYSLINVNFNVQSNAIVNHFNISTIKKRIMMMNAKRSSNVNLTRYMFLVPAVIALLLVFSVSKAELNNAIKSSRHLFKNIKTAVTKIDLPFKAAEPAKRQAPVLKALSLHSIEADTLQSAQTLSFADTIKKPKATLQPGIKIFVDGVLTTNGEMNKIDPANMARISVYKNPVRKMPDYFSNDYVSVITKDNDNTAAIKAIDAKIKREIGYDNTDSILVKNVKINGALTFSTAPAGTKHADIDSKSILRAMGAQPGAIDANTMKSMTRKNDTIYYTDKNGISHTLHTGRATGSVTIKADTFYYNDKNHMMIRTVPGRSTFSIGSSKQHGKAADTTKYIYVIGKLDTNKLKAVTKMRINSVTMTKGKTDSSVNVVKGYEVHADGTLTKNALSSIAVTPRSNPSITFTDKLIIVDGKEATQKDLKKLSADKIDSVNIYNVRTAISKYGDKGKNGVIVITTKK